VLNGAAAKRAERDNPPRGRFLSVGKARVHVVEKGEGPAILLIHGNGTSALDFELSGVPDRLARSHRVLIPDRPGFGHSTRPRTTIWTPQKQAEVMAGMLRQLGVEQAVVVGHSFGSQVALALALHSPALVRSLVLLSGYYFATLRPDVLLFSPPAIPGIGDVLRYTVAPPFARLIAKPMFKASFSPAPMSPSFHRFPLSMVARPSQIRATAEDAAVMVPAAMALGTRFGELQLPVEVVAGEGDKIAWHRRHAVAVQAALPRSNLTILPDVGHLVHHTAPDAVATVIERAATS
jgi:pimeloyl-ACP methyl ester carboxylesterase